MPTKDYSQLLFRELLYTLYYPPAEDVTAIDQALSKLVVSMDDVSALYGREHYLTKPPLPLTVQAINAILYTFLTTRTPNDAQYNYMVGCMVSV